MRACIHRGSKQIGGSCVEIEHEGQRLLIDLGLPLDAESNDSQYLPPIGALDGSDPSLLGILISHPHLDHFGLLAHISPSIPIGMGAAARRILSAAAPFLPGNWPIPAPGWDYETGQSFATGSFRITPYLVDHSAYDAYAFLIEAGGKRLFYSGDFRAHGRKSALFERLVANPPGGVDALLVEGSSLGRLGADEHFPTEAEIEAQLIQSFSATDGLAMVHTSVQNIDRIVSILRACRKTGRKLVIDLYAAAILEATENRNLPQSDWPDVALFVPRAQRLQIKENAWFDLLNKHSKNRIFIETLQSVAKQSTVLFRPLHRYDLEKGNCLEGASYIYSQWEGYWEQGMYDDLRSWLERNNIKKQSIHTSGHASPADLKTFVASLAPKKVVPIHSFTPERYPEMFAHVEPHHDGEWWEV
ncbi:MAG: MBL fold metallo-hydrolase [Nitrosomonadales bacterium]|nr:MAG: MBL fold metallo-hydrolase [Nitrosomonadales bacterium]